MIRNTLLVLSLMLLFCCNKKSDFTPLFAVPDEFKPYVDSFWQQAASHGVSLQTNNLIIKYDSTLPLNICGQSNVISADNNIQKIISINPHLKCWNNGVELETLIFHEMGHCILGRSHDNSLLPNGSPKSIMVADNISLFSTCVYPIDSEPCDKTYREDYYMDELFAPSTPVPDWAK